MPAALARITERHLARATTAPCGLLLFEGFTLMCAGWVGVWVLPFHRLDPVAAASVCCWNTLKCFSNLKRRPFCGLAVCCCVGLCVSAACMQFLW